MTMIPLAVSLLVFTASPVSLQFDGSLKDALKEIAKKGNLNVVVAGDLNQPVQVNLTDIAADEALETVSKIYGLELTHQGKLWVVRAGQNKPEHVVVPPAPPAPPTPPAATTTNDDDDAETPAELARQAAEDAAEAARDQAEAAREQAEAMREQAKDLAQARRDQEQAARDMAMAHADLERNRVAAGGPVRVEANTKVETAVAYGGPVIVEENAVVDGDAVAFGGDVVLKDNAVINGDAVSFGGSVVRAPSAVVHGESVSMGGAGVGGAFGKGFSRNMLNKAQHEKHDAEASDASPGLGNRVALFLLQFALFFGLGFVLMIFAPGRMKAIEATIRAEPTKNGVAGFFGLLAAIPATLVLVVTLIGIPVAMLMWLGLALFVPVGLAAVANTIGAVLPTGRVRKTQALALALGLLVLMIVAQIPVLGPLVILPAVFVSLGAIIRTRFGQPLHGTPVLDSMPHAATL
jgi:hypothetical protein